MPTLARRIERLFLGRNRNDEKDAAIDYHRAQLEENAQAMRDSALVLKHMSGMIRFMAESNVQK